MKETSEESIVSLGGRILRDEGKHIASIQFLSQARICGGEFNTIRDLPYLTELIIASASPSQEDFRTIAAYPRLRHIEVVNCNTLDNEALKVLLTNKQIEVLILDGGDFDDSALVEIAGLPKLNQLWLRKSRNVSSRATLSISKCLSLSYLNLSSTSIDDSAAVHLSKMPQLERLELDNTNVSDVSIQSLGAMKQLKWLDLNRTRVTKTGFDELQRLLPNCKIYGSD